MRKIFFNYFVTFALALLLIGCGGGTFNNTTNTKSDVDTSTNNNDNNANDEFSKTEYKGLVFYHKNLPPSSYKLEQLSDSDFNALSSAQKLQVANKLLNSLFFGYPLKELQEKIDSGGFLSSIRASLEVNSIDRAELESYISNDENFKQYTSTYYLNQVNLILTRFYAANKLDKYFFENWVAYILTQTILFSPAYELSNTHTPNISSVYNRLVNMLDAVSYTHLTLPTKA